MILKHKVSNICELCCTRIENFGVVSGKVQILENVNLHIHCGELTAIIGPNGAGKSTLLKAILGEVKHTGQLKFLDAKGAHTGHPMIGYVPQQLNFDAASPTSVFDLFAACREAKPVWLYSSAKQRERVRESLSKVQIEHVLDRKLGELSGGELQRVLLALALDPIPNILLLDEPVSGVDKNGMELFYDTVAGLQENYDLSIILVSHDLPLVARHADRAVLLNQTVLASGTPQEVFQTPSFIQTFGTIIPMENDG